MSYEHDYYSDQCAGCKWAEWRGGCLNKATADDGSDLDAADRGECRHFEAGQPQKRPPQPGDRVYVHIPLAEYDSLRARAKVAEQRAEALAAELAQARADLSQAHGFLAESHKQLDELEGILSDALAARARAEAEVERLRTALGGAQ